jgi:hypothetical protein
MASLSKNARNVAILLLDWLNYDARIHWIHWPSGECSADAAYQIESLPLWGRSGPWAHDFRSFCEIWRAQRVR